MTTGEHSALSRDETQALQALERVGTITAELYRHGQYSEPEFVLHGVMQRLVIRGLASYLGCSSDPQTIAYSYGLAEGLVRAAA